MPMGALSQCSSIAKEAKLASHAAAGQCVGWAGALPWSEDCVTSLILAASCLRSLARPPAAIQFTHTRHPCSRRAGPAHWRLCEARLRRPTHPASACWPGKRVATRPRWAGSPRQQQRKPWQAPSSCSPPPPHRPESRQALLDLRPPLPPPAPGRALASPEALRCVGATWQRWQANSQTAARAAQAGGIADGGSLLTHSNSRGPCAPAPPRRRELCSEAGPAKRSLPGPPPRAARLAS